MDVSEAPGREQVEQAKEDYRRSLAVLMADRAATELREKRDAVGKCFKFIERAGSVADDPPVTWLVYVAVVKLDEETGRLEGWHFQHAPNGLVQIQPDTDMQPGFLTERCVEVGRDVFVGAFNELLTAVAHFAARMP